MAILFLVFTAQATYKPTTQTWVIEENSLTAQFTPSTRCMTATGDNALTVTVRKQPQNIPYSGATVSATVTKPDKSTESIGFSSEGDGNYTYTYAFDANGTWKFSVAAARTGYTSGEVESYVYVGDFNLMISFVNNGESIYDRYTDSVRNLVTNEDGNYFTGIEGNVTIYYPNSSIWVSGQAMTESGEGEYYYNFTAPTALGEYSATSAFTCGANTDSNSAGQFKVISSCGNGICDSWESCSSCPIDCGQCPGPPGPGGGGGGGGAPSTPYKEPAIVSWKFDKTPQVASESKIIVEIANPGEKKSFVVKAKISQVKDISFEEEQVAANVGIGKTRLVEFEKAYLPRTAGTHTIEIQLFSFDRRTLYDEAVETFDIEGKVKYDVIVECLEGVVKKGSSGNAKITVLNLGDYYEDVKLAWWVEDSQGKVVGASSLAMALYTNESKELVRSIAIPRLSERGLYSFKVEVDYKGEKTLAGCSFLVEEDKQYYEKALASKEEKLKELAETAAQRKAGGFDVSQAEEKLGQARVLASVIGGQIEISNFDDLDEKIAELDALLAEAEIALETPGAKPFSLWLGLKETLLLLAVLLLIILALILYRSKGLLDKVLGLEETREKKQRADSTAEKMLGLKRSD